MPSIRVARCWSKGVGLIRFFKSRGAQAPLDTAARSRFLDAHIIVHTHIEKTAGSTLSRALHGLAGDRFRDTRDGGPRPAALPAEEKTRLHVLAGHIFYGVHQGFDQKPLYMAAVRDPVAREVSHYRYLLGHPEHPAHKTVAGKGFSEGYAAFTEFRGAAKMQNRQCQHLTGKVDPLRLTRNEVRRRLERDYFLVIPSDRMTETLGALLSALGLDAPVETRVNVSSAAPVDVPDALADQIRQTNALDDWMVREAERLFAQKLDAAQAYIAGFL